MGILENKFWLNLREAVGDAFPGLMDDRFETRAGRQRHKQEVSALLRDMFRSRTLAQWCDAFQALDLPFSPLLQAGELFADPHVRARGMVRELDGGRAIALRFPVRFSLGLPDSADHVPALGEHNGAA